MRNLILFFSASIICVIGNSYIYGDYGVLSGPGFNEIEGREGLKLVIYAIAITTMLAGIICGVVFDCFADSSDRVKFEEIVDALASKKMIRAAAVSPLVFFSLLSGLRELQDIVMISMFAFQNGFFWQKTLSPVDPRKSTDGT